MDKRDFVAESNGRDCEHGNLARKCLTCELLREIAALEAQLADRDAEIERLRAELALRKDYADQCRAQDATIHRLKLELDAYERAVREARDGVR